MIDIKNMSFKYNTPIFKNVSLSFPDSSFVCIHGKSGCGKTTFLKLLSCELPLQEGKIIYNNIEINQDNSEDFLFNHVSYITQNGDFFSNMNIREHFEFYAQLHGINISDQMIRESLDLVNLNDIDIKKYPDYLSVGQRKRFLIALALFVGKDIILLDEPTASLDQKNKEILLEVIKRVSNNHLIICSTHDAFIIESANTIYKIEDCNILTNILVPFKNKQEHIELKKPQKIKYYKYKNFKLRLLYLIMFILGAFTICFISYLISHNTIMNMDLKEESHAEETMGLVFYKNTDARWIDMKNPDFVENSEIESIKDISGVKEVIPYYALNGFGADPNNYFHITNHQGKNIDVSYYWPESAKKYGKDWYANVAIFSYDKKQNIKVDGKEIEGVYIDKSFANLLGDNFEVGDELSFDFFLPTEYVEDYSQASNMKEEVRAYRERGAMKPVSFEIAGIMPEEVYDDEYSSIDKANFVRLYVPVEQVQSLLQQNAKENTKHVYNHSMTYLVLCENDKKSQVKIDIENMNELYHADYQGKNTTTIIVSESQFNYIIYISIFILVVGDILLALYYISSRKNEIVILKREGLSHCLRKFYSLDLVHMIVGWLVISGVMCYVYRRLAGVIPDVLLFSIIWMSVSLAVVIFISVSFEVILFQYIRNREQYD